MHCVARHIALTLLCCLFATQSIVAQSSSNKLDSVNLSKLHFTQNKFINNLFKQAVNSLERSPDDGADNNYLSKKSEKPFLRYQGKIIRHITVETVTFDRAIEDTGKHDNSTGAKLGNKLHVSTRRSVIRDNLFIKENTPLNAYKVADNERYLRSLDYIHEARIRVYPIPHNPDSVDITVYTKDLFSIAGGMASDGLNHINANLFETNLAGLAQRVEVSGLYDYHRSPGTGDGFLYRKDNVKHSFLDATVGYSTMDISSFTHEEQTTEYLSLNRQLISPYSRMAGGLTLSYNAGYNAYHIPETDYFIYKYKLFDAWAGYNIGIKHLTATTNTIRDRRFFSLRFFDRDFSKMPQQVGTNYDPIYNTTKAILGQITFFRQDYFKTQYIYGFGSTEDLPYGYNISLTAGWHEQLNLQRFYTGINVSHYLQTNMGDFIQLYLKTGGYYYKNALQDAGFLAGVTAFSRLFFWNSTKIRQYVNLSFSHIQNRVTTAPLRIDNYYGIRGFLTDSAYGNTRLSLQLETEFFLKFKFLGFQFAPFPYADLSIITPHNTIYLNSSLYTSLGFGIRARNENLVFQTIELRAFFFPISPSNMRSFKLVLDANIRYRYSSNFITPPDVIQLNTQ